MGELGVHDGRAMAEAVCLTEAKHLGPHEAPPFLWLNK
jgi:hypothetical protein